MKVTLVFPVKDQSAKLLKGIKDKVIPYFDGCGLTYDAIIVADGSCHEQYEILEEAMKELPMNFSLTPEDPHKGKGHGVKVGIMKATGDYVLFMDADMSTDLSIFDSVKKYLGKKDAIIASRYCKGARIKVRQPLKRRIVSKGSRILIKWMFRFKGIKDTQCGYKCFRTAIAKQMAKHQIIDRFAFDVEYLYMLKLNKKSIVELPAIWSNDDDSSLRAGKASVEFFSDMLKIKRNKKNYYFKEEDDAHR